MDCFHVSWVSATLAIKKDMDNKTQKVFDFIKDNPKANKEAISTGVGFAGLHLFNLLRKLQNDDLIETIGEGDDAVYILCQRQTDEVNKETVEKTGDIAEEIPTETVAIVEEAKTEVQQQTEITPKEKPVGRNNTQYVFNDKVYGKGPLVHAVVAKYVEDHPGTTFEQLKEIFADTLMKRFGVFAKERDAKDLSGKVNRYFLKPEQLIKLKDEEEPIAVCNQWTSALLEPFLEIAAKLGYIITEKQD
jgi:hypothetical protein